MNATEKKILEMLLSHIEAAATAACDNDCVINSIHNYKEMIASINERVYLDDCIRQFANRGKNI
jgi:hypothetical protein